MIDLRLHCWWLMKGETPVAYFSNEQLAVETAWQRVKDNVLLHIRTPEGRIREWYDYAQTRENKYILKHKDAK